jgi:diphosphomevalonate decarboxylase
MYGGFVTWEMGTKDDGSDSTAIQVKPETHWPELQILVLVVSDKKKSVGSTVGMQKTVQTSKLLQVRLVLVNRF